MSCKPCEERWRIILAQQSKTIHMSKNAAKPKEGEEGVNLDDNGGTAVGTTTPAVNLEVVAPVNVGVPKLGKPDVNKIIEDRRKAIQDGKVINK